MPRYWSRQKSYKSFLRQLSMYQFRRESQGEYKGAYGHPDFRRGMPQLCDLISRRERSLFRSSVGSGKKHRETGTCVDGTSASSGNMTNEQATHSSVGNVLRKGDSVDPISTVGNNRHFSNEMFSSSAPSMGEAHQLSHMSGAELFRKNSPCDGSLDLGWKVKEAVPSAADSFQGPRSFQQIEAVTFIEPAKVEASPRRLLVAPSSLKADFVASMGPMCYNDDILDEIIRTFLVDRDNRNEEESSGSSHCSSSGQLTPDTLGRRLAFESNGCSEANQIVSRCA